MRVAEEGDACVALTPVVTGVDAWSLHEAHADIHQGEDRQKDDANPTQQPQPVRRMRGWWYVGAENEPVYHVALSPRGCKKLSIDFFFKIIIRAMNA